MIIIQLLGQAKIVTIEQLFGTFKPTTFKLETYNANSGKLFLSLQSL